MFGGGQQRGQPTQTKGSDINVNLEIEFMEAILGAQKYVSIPRLDQCGTCKGTRCRPGSAPTTCGACGGKGFQAMRQGPFVVQEVCHACDGFGQVIRSPCVTCSGKGSIFGQARENITIPKGVDSGVNLRVSKKGNAGEGGPAGDLIVHVKVKPHAYFKREGANINSDCFVSISQAVLGSEVNIKTLYGDIKLKVAAGT